MEYVLCLRVSDQYVRTKCLRPILICSMSQTMFYVSDQYVLDISVSQPNTFIMSQTNMFYAQDNRFLKRFLRPCRHKHLAPREITPVTSSNHQDNGCQDVTLGRVKHLPSMVEALTTLLGVGYTWVCGCVGGGGSGGLTTLCPIRLREAAIV